MNLVFASGFLIPQTLKRLAYFRDIAKLYPGALFPRVSLTCAGSFVTDL